MEPDIKMKEKIAYWSTMEGMIKKKRKEGLLSRLDSSVNRYFKLWCDGKFFCYYDEKPVGFWILFSNKCLGLQETTEGCDVHHRDPVGHAEL